MTSSHFHGPKCHHAGRARIATEAGSPFQQLAPTTVEFATRPILDSFNWSDCLADVEAGEWYLVAFRSVRRATADVALLTAYDERAHAEALGAGGLLYYFKGEANERRQCLSFCIWESRPQAQAAARLPLHLAATRIAKEIYESYELERYIMTKRSRHDGGHVTITRLQIGGARATANPAYGGTSTGHSSRRPHSFHEPS
jgi:hypothetical protein